MKSFFFLPVIPSDKVRGQYSEIRRQDNHVVVLGEHENGVILQRRFFGKRSRIEVLSKKGILVHYGQDFKNALQLFDTAKNF